MIPIRDTQTARSIPVVTLSLIALNAVVFLFQVSLGSNELAFLYKYGLVPAKLTVPDVSAWYSFPNLLISFFTYMFLHGGWLHFLGNMWFLYVFGDNVEDYFGSLRFTIFYLASGIASGLCHFILNPVSTVPTIGASGAIAGVMGAYMILFPRSKILTLIPIIIIPWFVEIPAFLFLGFWFLMQFFNAAGSGTGSGIAWWAHVGGFIAGMAFVKLSSRIPSTGASQKIKTVTARKTTPKLQVIHASPMDDYDLMGDLEISQAEASRGARKIVNIPWGFYKRLYRVTVPPGLNSGTRLRLAGMGRIRPDTSRGDMYLKVIINHEL